MGTAEALGPRERFRWEQRERRRGALRERAVVVPTVSKVVVIASRLREFLMGGVYVLGDDGLRLSDRRGEEGAMSERVERGARV